MDITVVDRPELRIAGIRHIGPYPQIGRAFGSLGGILKGPPPAGRRNDCPLSPIRPPTQPDRLRSDAALTLPSNARTPDGLIEQRVPAGRVCARGAQDSSSLPATWNALKNGGCQERPHDAERGYELYVRQSDDDGKVGAADGNLSATRLAGFSGSAGSDRAATVLFRTSSTCCRPHSRSSESASGPSMPPADERRLKKSPEST